MTTPAYRTGWDGADELVHFLSSPYVYRRPDNMSELEFCDFLIEEMERDIEKIGAERIACFIAEPILVAGGVLVPPAGYHKRSLEVCRRFEIKYVSDEVGSHFMMGIEFVHDKFSKKPFENSINIGMRVSNHAQARGLIVRPLGHMIVLSPPLILNSDDVKQIGNILHESILATFEDLTREKLM